MASEASAAEYANWAQYSRLGRGLDWLAARQRAVLALGVVFQVLFLVAMMVRPLITLTTGETILLRVAPVDPRDIFRGDYVTLSYEISRPGWNGAIPWQANWQRMQQLQGKTIYVQLEPDEDGKHWHATDFQMEPPAEGRFIRGEVMANGIVHFGIEQYFVQEGLGKDYEKAVRQRKLSAEVVLGKDGGAQIKRLIIE